MNSLRALLRRPLLHVAGFSLCINLLMLIPALFMLQVFDRVLVSRSTDTLLVLLAGAAIGLLILLTLDQLRVRLQATAGQMVGESLAPAVTRILMANGARREGRASTEGLRDVNALRALFSAQGLLALFDAPWLLVYVAIIWAAHPWLGITASAAALLMVALAVLNDALTRAGIEVMQGASASATRFLEASLANAEVAQALGMTNALISRWQQRGAQVSRLQGPATDRLAVMAAVTRTLRQAVQVIMLSVGASGGRWPPSNRSWGAGRCWQRPGSPCGA
jgi:ABC-type protease/lipase transport system fused ATPase/permease subunit